MFKSYSLLKNSPFFDPDWYASKYRSANYLGVPAVHFLTVGWRQGLNPSPHFDTRFYLQKYPDVANAKVNPLVHYIRYGQKEGRVPKPPLKKVKAPSLNTDIPSGPSEPYVLFVSGEPVDRPSFLYRVERWAPAFDAVGLKAIVIPLQEIERSVGLVSKATAIHIWRARFEHAEPLFRAARQHKVPVIYDLDDLMVRPDLATEQYIDAIRYEKKDPSGVQGHYSSIRKAASHADAWTASTHELAWQMRQINPSRPAFVLPNGFDADTYSKSRVHARAKADDGIIRIGYASGSRTHQGDFRLCSEVVADSLRRYPNTRLVLFRRSTLVTLDLNEFPEFAGLDDRIEWREFVPLRELPSEIARFDINLAPLEYENPFCEAKSELKYFEAAICDVPTIASPTGPFRRAITPGATGYLAYDKDDWRSAIRQLIEDKELRLRIGRAAHHAVLWHFGPKRRPELAYFLRRQIDGGRASAYSFRAALNEPKPKTVPLASRRIVFDHDAGKESKATVIIPVFNYTAYIEEAMQSVYDQTLRDIDLVLVDDASTDDSLAVMTDWAEKNKSRFNRLVIAQHEINSGLGASRNTAFDLADTLHVMALDADNKLRPLCCEKLIAEMDAAGAVFAYPTIEKFGDDSGLMGNRPYKPTNLVPGNYIDAMAMISKEAWALVGGYATHRLGWQDFDFWCRIAERGLHGIHVDDVLADYRVHGKSMLRTATDAQSNKADLLFLLETEHPWLSLHSSIVRVGHQASDARARFARIAG